MDFLKRYKVRSILVALLWIIIGCGSTVLLVAAVKKNDEKKCTGINIDITGVSNHYFIDRKDVEKIIVMYSGGQPVGKSIDNFDLKKMEGDLKKDIWIKGAEIFFDNNGVLQVDIEEREPVARVFTPGGSTFYIDSSLMMLPLSDKFSARLPVFTGFPSEAKVLKKADSALLKDVRDISMDIQSDSFLMGMIDQVDITPERTFEMMPKIGNQLIVFGDASDAPEKFRKLRLFYKNIMIKTGWNRYSIISLQYKGQVVGKIRGADDVSADSLRTLQMMATIAANAEKMAADSIKTIVQDSDKNIGDTTMIQQSIQRDENTESEGQMIPAGKVIDVLVKPVPKVLPATKPSVEPKKPVTVIKKPAVINKKTDVVKKTSAIVKKPKPIVEKKPAIKYDY